MTRSEPVGTNVAWLPADVTSTATALADIPNLFFPVAANANYWFRFFLVWESSALTTGINLSINGPASPTKFVVARRIALTLSTESLSVLTAYNGGTVTASIDAANAPRPAGMEGLLQNGANAGSVVARVASEVAASTVRIKAGSCVHYWQV